MSRNWLFFFTVILGFYCLAMDVSGADTGVVVQPIAEAALDDLIHNKENTLIVSFMAAWCGPCIDELPALNRLYRKYKDQGLKLIGISIDLAGTEAIQPIVTRLKIEFPIYWYGDKAIAKFNLVAIPLLLVIKKGKIVERLPGQRSEAFLASKVNEILK
jgi:thiol-disulfide isomerase/thioredoxin